MNKGMAGAVLFSLVLAMIIPAHAQVTSIELEKNFYTNAESFKFIGSQDGKETVFVIIRDSGGKFKGMLSDPAPDQGEFSVIPRSVTDLFSSAGIYDATAFVNNQKENEGMTVKIEYDGEKIFQVPDFVLTLKPIQDVTTDEGKTVSFTVGITDDSIDGVVYSLEKNPPTGATIDSETGKFTWIPSSSHGNSPGAKYTFDIVAAKASQVDRESITITVNDPIPVTPEPRENKAVGSEEPLEVPAPFVDESKDPQSYVERYNNEAGYKKWFDENYPEYDSIYQAVGSEEPLEVPAPFVDESKDPQSYVERYNNEAGYKKWFDENYPEYDSIYQAVGSEEPTREKGEKGEEPEFGECGAGTDLIGDTCVIVDNSQGGGCLVATAAYGTELAPQVQFLREVRDNTVMSTSSGAAFMTGFNQVYYSFSPTIADLERENPMLQKAVRALITPMVSTLSIMTLADSGSEIEVLGLGISVIALNLGMYVALPAIIVLKARKVIG